MIVSYFPAQFIFINLLMIIINKNRLSLCVYLGFIVHCGGRDFFSHNATYNSFGLNLAFLMNFGDC